MATVIRKGCTAVGVGLLEDAIQRESIKGCTPFLCSDPVQLEPPYHRFDANLILAGPGAPSTLRDDSEPGALVSPDTTFNVYAAPEDLLTIEWMEDLLRALAVMRGPIVFELSGRAGSVWIRFAVPSPQTPGLVAGINGLFPAIRLVEEPAAFPHTFPTAVEELVPVPPYWRSLTLLGQEGASPLGIAAITISNLSPDDTGLFQVLVSPADANNDWHYNIENLAEAEHRAARMAQLGGLSSDFAYDETMPPLVDPSITDKVRRDVAFFATVVRYCVWSADPTRVDAFLQGMRVACGMLRFGNRAWRTLSDEKLVGALGRDVVARMVSQRLSHRPGLMLTSRELASLVHIPNARTLEMFTSIEQRTGLEWRTTEPEEPRRTTARLGTNTYAGRDQVVSIPMSRRLRHTYVVGATGMGKSTLYETLILDDIANGVGVCVVDPHGDLCKDILARVPQPRMDDLIYISFSEPGLVPRWNPFLTDAPSSKVADDFSRAIASATSYWGVRMEHNFRHLAYVIHQLGGTLDDLAEMVGRTPRGEELRQRAVDVVENPAVQRFLREDLPSYSSSDLDPVRTKLSRLLLDENLGAMFRQPDNELHPRRWMDSGKVVLVNLDSGILGADHTRFVGGLLVSLIHRAALSRSNVPRTQRRPFLLYLDECQLLQTAALEEILSEGRKYGLAAVLAHQEGGQLDKQVAFALGNCDTRVAFRPGTDDLPRVRRALLNRVTPEDLSMLGVGEAYVASGEHVGSLNTQLCPYAELRDSARAARQYAREHYLPIESEPRPRRSKPKRRPRVFDTFGLQEE